MKKLLIAVLTLVTLFTLAACSGTDVVANVSKTSFEAILNQIPDKIAADDTYNAWALTSPTGERFLWSKDFSSTDKPDGVLEFDAKPFLDAGLDVTKLPEWLVVSGDKILYKTELGNEKFNQNSKSKPIEAFKEIVRTHRSVIGYHEKLDHYGVALGNGNAFEWAKDMNTNDKDIVFVLNPQPFIDAGVKADQVEGWAFAKVDTKDESGKPIQVDKFLKPFNLK